MKKKHNKIFIGAFVIMIVLLGVVASNIILNKTYKTKYEDFNSLDKKMFEQLSNIYNQFEKNSDKLWNDNYRLNELTIILIRTNQDKGVMRKYAYAINVKGIKNSIISEKIDMPKSLNLPPVYRVSKFDIDMISTWFPSNFGTLDIDGENVFYFKYHHKMIENPDLYFDFSSFLLHESFHVYNQKDWTYDKNDGEYIENYPENKENYAFIGLEFKLLDKCMESVNKEEIKKYLKDWTIVRTYRYEKWPQLMAETNTEAIEGVARYIEYRYSKLTGGRLTVLANKEKPYHVTFSHAFDCFADGTAKPISYLKRPIKYETGSALGLIMDKLGIKWKEDIEDGKGKDGKTQYEVLKKYFNVSNDDITEGKMNEIKQENSYNELLRKGQNLCDLQK